MNAFDRLHPALQHHIVNSLGWRELREVQSLSIEAFLTGANLVILAPTAGGKTESAFFPVISQMLDESWSGISVLYVSPIKALLNNQEQRLDKYMRLVGRQAALWHGDTPQGERKRIIAEQPDCLLTTPESLEVLLVSQKVDHHRFFENVRVVVIDELHAFAGDDRGWHLLSVFSRIARIANRDLQRIGLSATVGNPEEMLDWLSSGSERPQKVVWPKGSDSTPPDVQLDFVGSLDNAAKVVSLLHRGEKRLVFCDSRSRVEQLAVSLRQYGVDTFVSHSSLSLDERRQAEEAFAQRQNCVIVATSSLELGLDVGDLDRVVQIDAPGTVSSFLQRMGRTGRRPGAIRNCLFLATGDEGLLRAAALIELWQRGYVEPVQAPAYPYHILAQQLMALILQERGIGRSQWFPWVEDVPGFAQMPPERVGELVEHMITAGLLWSDGGLLGFAPEGERAFGRRNFMDILSVFTSPPLFTVVFGQKELGKVHESTFYRRDDGPAILVLAGRNWKTKHLDWKRRIAYVEPTDQKGRSRWLGEGQLLNHSVCQSIRRILSADDNDAAWSERAIQKLYDIREEHPWVSDDATSLVQMPNGHVRWWTFAGGIANSLLADALKLHCDVKADNLSLSFPPASSFDAASEQIDRIGPESVKPIPNIDAMDNLKFSECLPMGIASELFCTRFDDRAGVEQVLRERRRSVILG
ncbi:DEAD/DEAH box helicase [Rhodopirellula sp. JC639]|uniref:DEAD/DEAH box helicase n=1 Tax=Stieleria mannarensis TaxID=2755585 RepID=UPI0016026418|nr:DEAD/DEAH box helicase [Rhodopirellula sp. JC639]